MTTYDGRSKLSEDHLEEREKFWRRFKDDLESGCLTEAEKISEFTKYFLRLVVDERRADGKTDDEIIEIISKPGNRNRVQALQLLAEINRFPDGPYPFTKKTDEKDAYDGLMEAFGLTEEAYADYLRSDPPMSEAEIFRHIVQAREFETQRREQSGPPTKYRKNLTEILHVPLCRIGLHDWGQFSDGYFCYWCGKKRGEK